MSSDEKNGKKYCCHVDGCFDRCVIDIDYASSCAFGILESGRERKSKWTCEFWRPWPSDKDLALVIT